MSVFLLGSGASRPAKMASVQELTEQVLEGDGIVRFTSGRYINGDWIDEPVRSRLRERAEHTLGFVGELAERIRRYETEFLGRDYELDYEDIASLANQIADASSAEQENAAVLPLLKELESFDDDLGMLAREATRYIQDVVCACLEALPTTIDHLKPVIDGCRELGRVDLFELNHDRVLTTALAQSGLDSSDGFTRTEGNVSYWTGGFESVISHFQLHGSIDWFFTEPPNHPNLGRVAWRPGSRDVFSNNPRPTPTNDDPPMILAGTFDKALRYDGYVFAEQHFHFQRSLRETDALIVIGYGFRDKTINTRLIIWMMGTGRRLVIVHDNPERLIERARPAIRRELTHWEEDGRVQFIGARIEKTNWKEIAGALG
jgi:hypothetical protein